MHGRCTSLVILALLACSMQVAYAQSEAEGYSNAYLLRSVGARTVGMAGAYTSSVNEPNAMFCNAGALGQLSEAIQLSSMFSSMSFGRYQSTLAITKNLGSGIGLGLSYNSLNSPAFQRIDAGGNALGSATYQQYALGFGVGANVSSVGFGAVGHYLVDNLSGEGLRATGFAFDVGTKMSIARSFNFGMSVQNIGSVSWNNSSATKETLPWIIRSGLSTEISLNSEQYVQRTTTLGESDTVQVPSTRYILLALEVDYAKSSTCPHVILGAEYALAELLSLRGGMAIVGDQFGSATLFPMTVYSAGLSYRLQAPDLPFQLQLDYAVSHDYVAQSAVGHHFSLTVGF